MCTPFFRQLQQRSPRLFPTFPFDIHSSFLSPGGYLQSFYKIFESIVHSLLHFHFIMRYLILFSVLAATLCIAAPIRMTQLRPGHQGNLSSILEHPIPLGVPKFVGSVPLSGTDARPQARDLFETLLNDTENAIEGFSQSKLGPLILDGLKDTFGNDTGSQTGNLSARVVGGHAPTHLDDPSRNDEHPSRFTRRRRSNTASTPVPSPLTVIENPVEARLHALMHALMSATAHTSDARSLTFEPLGDTNFSLNPLSNYCRTHICPVEFAKST